MIRKHIKKIANIGIIVSGLGILITFPFKDAFWGGMLFSAFSAATIGGLADTFAVKALFGDPLGVKWWDWVGTRVLSKKRKHLIGELVKMVKEDLLSISNIEAKLNAYNFAAVMLAYLKEHGGEEEANAILQRLAGDVINRVDTEDLAKTIQAFLLDHADALQVAEIAADIGDWTLRNHYDEQIIDFVIHECMKLVKTREFLLIIERIVDSALRSYEQGKFGRKLVDSAAGLNASKVSESIQQWIISFLREFASTSHPYREHLKKQLEQMVGRLRTDNQLRERVEAGKIKLLQSIKKHIHLDVLLQEYLEAFQQAVAAKSTVNADIFPWITNKLHDGITKISEDSAAIERLDQFLKKPLLNWLSQKHDYIGQVVSDKLHSFSEKDLIKLLEEKVGHDLQYIRLNGIAIGSLVGIVLHLFTFWIGG
ncbi:DUF445 domain-containing protein [Paenibacillus eucommiae]|uniref:Uncharacterized membrane-anchored protein YjiN (DUF445 family) n=1 Tax=Paenibacillus eucommiae TaxID=1355755 RepID=A0ABS4IW14_9BACL|nr:DUF445 domain-containing protein [Paenibacillus eucommiae]MBP1991788.1 uncharacterized membrane-anchored protein YjiN (DUF445 family) [Paenibacillus eucommiae]